MSVHAVCFIFNSFRFSELETSKKQTEMDKKAVDDLVRERDILNKVCTTFNVISSISLIHLNDSIFFIRLICLL